MLGAIEQTNKTPIHWKRKKTQTNQRKKGALGNGDGKKYKLLLNKYFQLNCKKQQFPATNAASLWFGERDMQKSYKCWLNLS